MENTLYQIKYINNETGDIYKLDFVASSPLEAIRDLELWAKAGGFDSIEKINNWRFLSLTVTKEGERK